MVAHPPAPGGGVRDRLRGLAAPGTPPRGRGCPAVAAVLPFDRQHPLGRLLAFLAELRRERYHLALDLMGLLKSALIASFARAEVVLGASYNREGARLFY